MTVIVCAFLMLQVATCAQAPLRHSQMPTPLQARMQGAAQMQEHLQNALALQQQLLVGQQLLGAPAAGFQPQLGGLQGLAPALSQGLAALSQGLQAQMELPQGMGLAGRGGVSHGMGQGVSHGMGQGVSHGMVQGMSQGLGYGLPQVGLGQSVPAMSHQVGKFPTISRIADILFAMKMEGLPIYDTRKSTPAALDTHECPSSTVSMPSLFSDATAAWALMHTSRAAWVLHVVSYIGRPSKSWHEYADAVNVAKRRTQMRHLAK